MFHEVFEQSSANSSPATAPIHCKQQQFRLVDNGAEQRETHRLAVLGARYSKTDTCHRQDPGALGAGPSFAKAGIKRVRHYPHHVTQLAASGRLYAQVAHSRLVSDHAASGTFASGARA
jgi:hypothetical protein